jgi:Uma2 family endonuclease
MPCRLVPAGVCPARGGGKLPNPAGLCYAWRMSTALRKPMTLADFLDWEERQETRYEFDGWQPVAMTGGTDRHEAIGGNLRMLLQQQLRGKPCRVRGPTLKVEVMGRVRYPDAFVYCSQVAGSETVIRDPVVVFEVLSTSTSRIDRIEKLREYQATPSVQSYVILEQDSIGATMFTRQGADWIVHTLIEADTLALPEIGVALQLAEIYTDVTLPPPPPDDGR